MYYFLRRRLPTTEEKLIIEITDPVIFQRFQDIKKCLQYDDTELLGRLLEVWINAD
jgi:hypothetical protein